jgi:hypothetical protein
MWDSDDTVRRAMVAAGCLIERFLAPVEMGNLLLLAYDADVPVVSSPGYRSAKPNVLDLLLPALPRPVSCFELGHCLPRPRRPPIITMRLASSSYLLEKLPLD